MKLWLVAVSLPKFPSALVVAALFKCVFPLTAGALLTTHGDLSRGVVSNETSASPTPKWPSHHPAAWSVLRIWHEKQREAAASCPVRSRTDASSTRAANDIFGPWPPCDDRGSDQSSTPTLCSVSDNAVQVWTTWKYTLPTIWILIWCDDFSSWHFLLINQNQIWNQKHIYCTVSLALARSLLWCRWCFGGQRNKKKEGSNYTKKYLELYRNNTIKQINFQFIGWTLCKKLNVGIFIHPKTPPSMFLVWEERMERIRLGGGLWFPEATLAGNSSTEKREKRRRRRRMRCFSFIWYLYFSVYAKKTKQKKNQPWWHVLSLQS